MSYVAASLDAKRVKTNSGWGGWTGVSGWDLINSHSAHYVVYRATLGSTGVGSVSVSTNYAAAGLDYSSSKWANTTTMRCYLYTSDPTGSSSPPGGYVAQASYTVDVYDYGVYQTFYLTGFSLSTTTVYLWFTSDVVPSNGIYHDNYLISEATGNGITQAPSISADNQASGTGGATQPGTYSNLKVFFDAGISDVSISSYAKDDGIQSDGSHLFWLYTSYKYTMRAIVKPGYSFVRWSTVEPYAWSTSNPFDFNFGGFNKITAHTQINSYTVTVMPGTGISSVTGGGTREYGSTFTVSATLQQIENYDVTFDGWYRDGIKVSGDINYTFVLGAESYTLTAVAKVTSRGMVYIYDEETGTWKKYIPYVFHRGWKKTIAYVFHNGWKRTQ